MSYGDSPTKWYVHDCQFCYKRSHLSIEDEWDTEEIFCPNCGMSTESSELNFNDDTIETLDYDEDYEE